MSVITRVYVWVSRVLDMILRRRRDDRLTEEVQTHLELLARDYISRGLTPADARAAARRAFGGVDQMTLAYRDQRGLPIVDALSQDIRFAVRLMSRDRWFTATAVLVLGIGIGVNNMLFTVLNAHTLRGLPIARADRLVYISTFDDRTPDRGVSYPDFADIRSGAQTLDDVAAFTTGPVTIAADGRAADRLDASFVSANAFDVMGIRPVIGRSFAAADDRPGAAGTALLRHSVWQSRFGGDPGVLGRTILVNGAQATIIGVLLDRSGFPGTAEVWLPLRQAPGLATERRDTRNLRVVGLMRDGVAIDTARTEVETIADRLTRQFPVTNQKVRARVTPLNERFLGRVTDPGWLAFMSVGVLVVIISCANVANLMLARSIGRARELSIRASLGATRRRVLRQLLIEGALMATFGGTLGLAVSVAGVRLFRMAIPSYALPYWMDYSVDARVLAALVAVSIATVFGFALLPAFRASKLDLNRVLKDGGRPGRGDRWSRRWTTAFLAAEWALAVVLMAQVVVSFRSGGSAVPSDRTIDTRMIVTATVTLPAAAYGTPERRLDLYRRLDARLRSIAGVSSASFASALPMMGAGEAHLDIASSQRAGGGAQGSVRTVAIGPRYFQTLAVPMVRGREFDETDGTPGHAHAIVNERFVAQFFADQNPIGKQITLGAMDVTAVEPLTIVGIAANVRQRPVPDPDPVVYVSYQAAPPANMTLLVRTGVDPIALVPLLRQEVLALDANLPVYRIQTMADVTRDAQWTGRLSHKLVLFLTAIALALSTVGLYAVTAHGVSQRTQEIGVRMALGAAPRQVVVVIVRRVLAQLVFGFLAGILCTIAWQKAFANGRIDFRAIDPVTLAAVVTTLAIAAAVASFVPARRAVRLDPVAAIRDE